MQESKCEFLFSLMKIRNIYFFTILVLFGSLSWAGQRFSVQGRILTADGKPLTAPTVLFRIQVRSPGNEDCLLYQETQTLDMSVANGAFALTVGAGTRAAANVDGGNSLEKVFSNAEALSLVAATGACADASTSYTPSASATRKLLISYNDGNISDTFPVMGLNWVPQSMYSQDAGKLAGVEGTQYLRVVGATPTAISSTAYSSLMSLLAIPDCPGGQYLTISSGNYACGTPAGGGGGGILSVTSTNSYLSVVNGTTAPALTLNVGTSANTVAAGNDARITGAVQGAATPGGDLSGTYTSPTVAKIQNQSVSSTTPISGQVLTYSGSAWAPTNFGIGNLKTNLGASQFASASCSDNQTLTWSSLTDVFSCAAIDNLDASRITTGTLDATRLPATVKYWQDGGSGKIYYSGGNVGIGTTSPNSALHIVDGGGSGTYALKINDRINFRSDGVVYWGQTGAHGILSWSGTTDTQVGAQSGKNLILLSGGGEKMRIDALGNVGIGTTSPIGNLQVNASAFNDNGNLRIQTSNVPSILMGTGAVGWGVSVDTTDSNKLKIGSGTTNISTANTRMTIDTSGNVGIGTSTPAYRLDIGGAIRVGGDLHVTSMVRAYSGDLNLKSHLNDVIIAPNSAELMRLTSGGSVGIGTSTPSDKLDVQGGGVNASGGYTQNSDIRLKTNIEYLDSKKSLDKITFIRGIYYDWKNRDRFGQDRQVGLIAQDVEKVYPEAVKRNSEGFLSVSYSNLVAPVIESIKELLKISDRQARDLASIQLHMAEKDQKIQKLEQDNAIMKAWICTKDPQAAICK